MHLPASTQTQSIIRDNWLKVCSDVAEACIHSGRDPSEVQIVGVSKYVDAALTAQLVASGCKIIGENRPQVLWEKFDWFQQNQLAQPQWQLIGHLQRNKIRRSLPMLSVVQSVDSLRLAKELSEEAVKANRDLQIMIDVNLTQDETKTGMSREELWLACVEIAQLPRLRWIGLMAMSSLDADTMVIAREFADVRLLRDELQIKLAGQVELSQLSMGMSGDFREAIAEGSTCVRIGSSLWTGILQD